MRRLKNHIISYNSITYIYAFATNIFFSYYFRYIRYYSYIYDTTLVLINACFCFNTKYSSITNFV